MVTLPSRLTSTKDDLPAYQGVYFNIFRVPTDKLTELLEETGKDNRVIVQIDDHPPLHRALMPDGMGDYFVLINQEICKEYALEPGVEVSLSLAPDKSKYGMPLPEELAELWAIDDEAHRTFHLLTMGKQRGLIYQIAKPKGAQTRVKKAVQISEYLKSTGGVLDQKELNAYMKADNVNW